MKSSLRRKVLPFLLSAAAGLAACSAVQAEPAQKKDTVMIYMCGTDLEAMNAQGTGTISEILGSQFNPEQVNIVLMLGGATRWSTGYDPNVLTLLEIGGRRPRSVGTMELSSMGAPETLTAFMDFCYENYPAEHYDLVIWDHGGGPVYGVCQDALFQDTMDMYEVSDALAASPAAGQPLDMLIFHACLMGSAEVANKVAPYASYMVATEDSQYGLSYEWLKDLENDPDPLTSATRLAQTSFARNGEIIERQQASEINAISVVDLSKVQALVDAMDAFFGKVEGELNDTTFTSMSNLRRDATAFGLGDSGNVSGFDLVDLGDLVSKLGEEDPDGASALEAALKEAVVYCEADREGCTGLTVYYPFLNKQEMANRMAVYKDLGFSGNYTDYIMNFSAILSGTPLADWIDLVTSLPAASKDNRTLFALQLTEEQAAHFGEARLDVLLYDPEEDTYRFTFTGNKTSMEDGQLSGEFNGVAVYAVDEGGNLLSHELEYSLTADGKYLLPASLYKKGEGEEEPVTQKGLITCTLDPETKELVPGAVSVWEDSMNGYTTAYGMTLEDYDQVEMTSMTRRPVRNENGTLLAFEEWEEVGPVSWVALTSDPWSFKLVNDTLDTTTLYATFQVMDSQNNLYSSEPLVVKAEKAAPAEMRVAYDDMQLAVINSFSVQPVADNLVISADVQNITDAEAVIRLEGLTINGEAFEETSEVYGSGENWGLMPEETQRLLLNVPADKLAGVDRITAIAFNLVLEDAASQEQLGTVPVEVGLDIEAAF